MDYPIPGDRGYDGWKHGWKPSDRGPAPPFQVNRLVVGVETCSQHHHHTIEIVLLSDGTMFVESARARCADDEFCHDRARRQIDRKEAKAMIAALLGTIADFRRDLRKR